jgi:cation:H+ antiporter
MLANVCSILFGLSLLVIGAQLLVRGASRLAVRFGMPPLVVGLTIVAYGTSAPELAVSIQSCLADHTNIVLGNVVGANIFNVLFILGICAVITPLDVAPQMLRFDVPIMILVSLLIFAISGDGKIDASDGVRLRRNRRLPLRTKPIL